MDKYNILNRKIDDLLYIIMMLSKTTNRSYQEFFNDFRDYLVEIKNKATSQDYVTNGSSPGLFKWLCEENVMSENKKLWSSVLELNQYIENNF